VDEGRKRVLLSAASILATQIDSVRWRQEGSGAEAVGRGNHESHWLTLAADSL